MLIGRRRSIFRAELFRLPLYSARHSSHVAGVAAKGRRLTTSGAGTPADDGVVAAAKSERNERKEKVEPPFERRRRRREKSFSLRRVLFVKTRQVCDALSQERCTFQKIYLNSLFKKKKSFFYISTRSGVA